MGKQLVASTLGKLVHKKSGCGIAKRIPKATLLTFKTLEEAVSIGKKPCTCVIPRIKVKPKTKPKTPGVDVVRGPATSETHTTGGRFKAGNPGGPGNPHNREIKKEREAFAVALKSFNPSHIVDVLMSMYTKAIGKERNVAAANVFLNHTLGRPAIAISIKGEGGPLERLASIIKAGRGGEMRKVDIDVIDKAERDAKRS